MGGRTKTKTQTVAGALATIRRGVFHRRNRTDYAHEPNLHKGHAASCAHRFVKNMESALDNPEHTRGKIRQPISFSTNQSPFMIGCKICQRIISNCLDANGTLPKWTRNHLQTCSVCRKYYEDARNLARQISAPDKEKIQSIPPFLHARIMATVRSQENVEPQPRHARLTWAISATTLCLIAAALVWSREPSASYRSPSKPASAPAELAWELPSVTQVGQWTENLDSPLEQETKLILSDANTAINSLAKTFLPDDLLRTSSETRGQ